MTQDEYIKLTYDGLHVEQAKAFPTFKPAPDLAAENARLSHERDYWLRESQRLLKSGQSALGVIEAKEAELANLREAVQCLRNGYADAVSGYEYILRRHSRLSGVGFDRVMEHFFQWVTIPEREGLLAGSHKIAARTKRGDALAEHLHTARTLRAQLAERDETIARLQKVLKPFADCVEQISPEESDDDRAKFRLLVGNYRDALAALTTQVPNE